MSTHDETVVIGRVGKEPTLRYTPNGKAVCSLSLATDRGYGDNQKTQWWNVSIWGDSAERANQFVTKGSRVRVAGEVSARTYDKQDGTVGVSLDLNTFQWKFMSTRGESGGAQVESQAVQEEDDIPF